jgi:hypothetical protein
MAGQTSGRIIAGQGRCAAAANTLREFLSLPMPKERMMDGGARRDRTADLVNAIHALSQLSYGPMSRSRKSAARN